LYTGGKIHVKIVQCVNCQPSSAKWQKDMQQGIYNIGNKRKLIEQERNIDQKKSNEELCP